MRWNITGKRTWISENKGMDGGDVVPRLASERCEVLTAGSNIVGLDQQATIKECMMEVKPDSIIKAVVEVGGFLSNDTPLIDFLLNSRKIKINTPGTAHVSDADYISFLPRPAFSLSCGGKRCPIIAG